jgi:hypothetical protein
MARSSAGDRKEHRYDLIAPLRPPTGACPAWTMVWMKPNMSAVLKARPKAWLSIPTDQCLQRLAHDQYRLRREA